MSQLAFWLKNTVYPAASYILDGAGNIQFTAAGGISGSTPPTWSVNPLVPTTDGTITDWTWKGFGAKTFELQKPTGGPIAPYLENFDDAVSFSRGVSGSPPTTSPDAGKFVLLNVQGQIDTSMSGGGGGSVSVNGTSVSSPDFNDITPSAPPGSTNVIWQHTGSSVSAYVTATSTAFSGITSGTNTAALVMGSGGTLTVSGTGVIEATELATTGTPVNVSLSAPPTHAGQLLISQPGNTTAIWADPFVQGVFTPGISVLTGFSGGPIQPVLIGAQSPTDLLQNLHVDTNGNLNVNVKANDFGTVTVTGTVAVTQSTSPWVISGAVTEATLDAAIISQEATTSGVKGITVFGAVTTSAPSYTTGKSDALSLDTAGNLRVVLNAETTKVIGVTRTSDGSGNLIASTTEGSPPTTGLNVHVQNTGGVSVSGTVTANQGTITDTAPATANITAQDTSSASTTVANGQVFVTGSATANSTASFALASGFDTFQLLVTGTWTGTLAVEISLDGGTTWVSRSIHQTGTNYVASSFTANFEGTGNVAGLTNVRVRSTAAWTGTATVKIIESINAAAIYLNNPIRISDSVTQSNVATVKGASTAAVDADTSLVVQLNPKQPQLDTPLNVAGTLTHNSASPISNNIGVLPAVASSSSPIYNTGDQVLLSTDLTGQLRVNASFTGTLSSSVSFAAPAVGVLALAKINFSTVGSHTIIAGVSTGSPPVGQTIRIMRLLLVVGGTNANTVAFGDTTPATLLDAVPMLPYQSITLDLDAEPYYVTAAGKGFTITTTVAAQVSGTVWYTQS